MISILPIGDPIDQTARSAFSNLSFISLAFSKDISEINKICELDSQERKRIYLCALLDEMADDFYTVKTTSENITSNKTADILQYIDSHLFDNICISAICERFFISQPHLNRLFKNATGSTVWNYITTKRLLYAKELLDRGEHPTKVYEQCGYSNYVSFYKAYKKFFKFSPIKSQCKYHP